MSPHEAVLLRAHVRVRRTTTPTTPTPPSGSMVEQSAPFTDLVIVCDGPVGADLDAVIERWRGELGERLRVHRLAENRGLAGPARRPAAVPHRTVARMDSDDVSRPHRCELLLDALSSRDLDLVGGFISEFDRTPGDMASVREVPLEREDIVAFRQEGATPSTTCPSCSAARRSWRRAATGTSTSWRTTTCGSACS